MAILSGLLSCRKQRHSNSVILLWYTIGDGNILRKGILSQIRPVKLTCLLIFISKAMLVFFPTRSPAACSVGWFVSLLIREEVLLAGLCERKILFRLKIYDRLRQATAKRTGSGTEQFHRPILQEGLGDNQDGCHERLQCFLVAGLP